MPMVSHNLPLERREELARNASAIVANGKGILAADESIGTAGKRLATIGLENNAENRRAYREVLFSAAKELKEYLGGVILFEETVEQSTAEGKPLTHLLTDAGIIPGIKLDKGTVILPGTDGETTTQGLDGLAERCAYFYQKGCRFAKWRCTYKIGLHEPTKLAIEDNATVLARYAAICQANGLVPIVEPEILMDGDHDLEKATIVAQKVISEVYKKLHDHHVFLEGTLLKPSMVTPGQACPKKYTPQDIAVATLRVLQRTVPAAVPGICFLSGGQSEEEATIHLDAINRAPGVKPWRITFSYARALQNTVIKTWAGKKENEKLAQEALIKRALANSQASIGKYIPANSSSSSAASESLYVKDYRY